MTHPNRDEAFRLLNRFTTKPGLIKHAIAVEEVMRFFARAHQCNEDEWGLVGLVHDLDYEKFPEQHCQKTKEILESEGWPEPLVRAVMAHAWGLFTEVKPETLMEKYLYAADELSGFIVACALVRPTKRLADVNVEFIVKKWRVRSFAAGVNREVVEKGATLLGVTFEHLAGETLKALQGASERLDL